MTEQEVTKLSPQPGDLLIIRVPQTTSHDRVDAMVEELEHLNRKGVIPRGCGFLVVRGDIEVTALSPREMATLGWVRVRDPMTDDDLRKMGCEPIPER
jgi:hypothetical protein